MKMKAMRWTGCFVLACVLVQGCQGRDEFVSTRQPKVAYQRTEEFEPLTLGTRKRLADHTLMFAEFQVKYGVFHNYLHHWIDRPLFWDRSLRPEKFAYETPDSLAIHAREMKNAGYDGLNLFTSKRGYGTIIDFKSWLKDKGLADFAVLPTLGYGDDGRRTADPELFLKTIDLELKDPTFPRIGGKVLVPTYNYCMFKPAEHQAMMAKIDAQLGKGKYALCGAIDPGLIYQLQQKFGANGRLTVDERKQLEQAIADVLGAVGGLQLNVAEMKRPYSGQYPSLYTFEFFNQCMGPALERVYSRPEFQDKILGFTVLQGYVNHMSGNNNAEECTGTLRRCLSSVAKLNPDYLIFFEWNEVNENTMFQPTVWGGRTAARIVRYHSRLFKGLAPDVFPGDDPEVPPLALSYRALAKPGEELHFELLNIPDGSFVKPVKAQVVLRNPVGEVVLALPIENIDTRNFGAIDYLVKTTDLPADAVLTPSLVVDGKAYAGFAPVRIDPSVSWNYKAVRQCLRDLLEPAEAEIAVEKTGKRKYAYSCAAKFNEPLASLELVCNEDEQAAKGMEKEFDLANNYQVEILVTTTRDGSGAGRLTVKTVGAKGCQVAPHYTANVNSGNPTLIGDGEGFQVEAGFWSERVGYFLQIPKRYKPEDVTLEISRDDKPNFKMAKLPLNVVLEKGIASALLDEATTFRVSAGLKLDLPDLPPHLKAKDVSWQGETLTGTRYPVFHFRAISESGKIWRSRPIRPETLPDEKLTLPVYDEYAKKATEVEVPKALVPVIVYDFDPVVGVDLVNKWDPFFNAWMGGGTWYCEPYFDPRVSCPVGCRAPQWVEDEGQPCLKFDGVNDYVSFPKEAFPQAAFSLGMQIKPELPKEDVPMVLFRHYEHTRGSISVFIDRGELLVTWGDRNLSREPRIKTGLKIKEGEWNNVSISYDYHVFKFKVNGEKFSFPWEGRPFRFKPSVFGGHDLIELTPRPPVKPVYYRGLLRKLVFRHHP